MKTNAYILQLILLAAILLPTQYAFGNVCPITVKTTEPGLYSTSALMAFDGDLSTEFISSYDNWQFIEIDLGCVRRFTGLRRYMSIGGIVAARVLQGESVSVSQDGSTWTELTSATASGWESYVNYHPSAWHSVEYGWSKWLRPNQPLQVRYVRFHWDGNNDFLNEVELDASTVTSNKPAQIGTTARSAFDNDTSTYLETGFDNWQFVQIDLGYERSFSALRRHMTRDGVDESGDRWMQGESVSVSDDGRTWTDLTRNTTSGWESYVNYHPSAWHSVEYGWSEWLRPNQPLQVRYVRFSWDGNGDMLNEVEVETRALVATGEPATGTSNGSGLWAVDRDVSAPEITSVTTTDNAIILDWSDEINTTHDGYYIFVNRFPYDPMQTTATVFTIDDPNQRSAWFQELAVPCCPIPPPTHPTNPLRPGTSYNIRVVATGRGISYEGSEATATTTLPTITINEVPTSPAIQAFGVFDADQDGIVDGAEGSGGIFPAFHDEAIGDILPGNQFDILHDGTRANVILGYFFEETNKTRFVAFHLFIDPATGVSKAIRTSYGDFLTGPGRLIWSTPGSGGFDVRIVQAFDPIRGTPAIIEGFVSALGIAPDITDRVIGYTFRLALGAH